MDAIPPAITHHTPKQAIVWLPYNSTHTVTPPPDRGARSIVTNMCVCLCVCVCLSAIIIFATTRPINFSVRVTYGRGSGGAVIRNVLPVLWTRSYLLISKVARRRLPAEAQRTVRTRSLGLGYKL